MSFSSTNDLHANNTIKEKGLWNKIANINPPSRDGEYWSCNWLEGGLAFLDNTIVVCCAQNPPHIETVSNAEISFKKILIRRKEIIEQINNPHIGHPVCNCCQFLCKKRWPVKQYLFDYITIATQRLCNLNCSFCDLDKRDGDYSTSSSKYIRCTPLFKKMIKNEYISPYSTVNVSGGEPVLFPEFNEILEILAPRISQLIVFSNGTIFSETLFKSLKHPGMNLVLSLDAADPKIYKKIKGKDLCNKAWSNAGKYASASRERTIVKMIITRDNIDNIVDFVDRARVNNIKNLYYDLDKCETIIGTISHGTLIKYADAIANFKIECLKNDIRYTNAHAGCTKQIDDESERILKEKAKEIGVAVNSCTLKCRDKSFKMGKELYFHVDVTGHGMHDLHFKFLTKYENEDWKVIKNYSNDFSIQWSADRKGTYQICAYIREKYSELPFLDYCYLEFEIE